mmetsp:Transcript_393/g.1114  ORF Transcript_393/g.1114 Transcript_393/m.1114 type:complete len:369 (+) Transcript_393:261-1367(+)
MATCLRVDASVEEHRVPTSKRKVSSGGCHAESGSTLEEQRPRRSIIHAEVKDAPADVRRCRGAHGPGEVHEGGNDARILRPDVKVVYAEAAAGKAVRAKSHADEGEGSTRRLRVGDEEEWHSGEAQSRAREEASRVAHAHARGRHVAQLSGEGAHHGHEEPGRHLGDHAHLVEVREEDVVHEGGYPAHEEHVHEVEAEACEHDGLHRRAAEDHSPGHIPQGAAGRCLLVRHVNRRLARAAIPGHARRGEREPGAADAKSGEELRPRASERHERGGNHHRSGCAGVDTGHHDRHDKAPRAHSRHAAEGRVHAREHHALCEAGEEAAQPEPEKVLGSEGGNEAQEYPCEVGYPQDAPHSKRAGERAASKA